MPILPPTRYVLLSLAHYKLKKDARSWFSIRPFFITSHSREIARGLQHKHSLSPNIYLSNLTGAKPQSDNL
jgi:hypothetical protein